MNKTFFTRCPVLFENEDLMVINKPEGILSHPNFSCVIPERFNRESISGSPLKTRGDDKQKQRPLAAFEGPYDVKERCFETPAGPLWLIHRLDQDTSGILLAAKNKKSAWLCREAFEKKAVEKNYLALVSRKPMPPAGTWRDSLTDRHTGSSVRATIRRSGPFNAVLNYKMKEFFPKRNLALLEIKLVTGKTHQIRVQSAYHGHPVAGDRIYGNFALNKELRQAIELRRLFLHAWRLVIKHPSKHELLEITAALPNELEECLLRAKN